jgi:hypothetical protein
MNIDAEQLLFFELLSSAMPDKNCANAPNLPVSTFSVFSTSKINISV